MNARFFHTRLSYMMGFTAMALLPMTAHAQGTAVYNLLSDVYNSVVPLLTWIAVLMVVLLSVRLISSQDEGTLTKTRTGIGMILSGIVFVRLTPRIVEFFYTRQIDSLFFGIDPSIKTQVVLELFGIAEWIVSLALIVGVAMIILSSFRAVASFGSEGAATANKRSILYAILGIIVIGLADVLRMVMFQTREPNALIAFVFQWVEIVFGFLLLIMVAVIIYAGVLLILSFSDEGNRDKAKGIILRAVVGLILIIFSISIVEIVLQIFG